MPSDQRSDQSPRVVAIVAVYKAPADLFERVDTLVPQVHSVVLVDDGSESIDPTQVTMRPSVNAISLARNSGIARALNVGVEFARTCDADFVLTLDQDSTVSPQYVSEALRTYELASRSGVAVGFVAPEFVGGAPVLKEGRRQGFEVAFDPIQSGLLIPFSTIIEVGGFDEQLFIDAVDTDFTVRARSASKLPIVAQGLRLEHSLGELLPIRVFGKQVHWRGRGFHVLYHAPFRTYYMVRNSRYISRSLASAMPRSWWRLRNRKMTSMILGAIVLGPRKAAQLRAIWYGAVDARGKRLGRISQERNSAIDGHHPEREGRGA